jgi:hypothetical protein
MSRVALPDVDGITRCPTFFTLRLEFDADPTGGHARRRSDRTDPVYARMERVEERVERDKVVAWR